MSYKSLLYSCFLPPSLPPSLPPLPQNPTLSGEAEATRDVITPGQPCVLLPEARLPLSPLPVLPESHDKTAGSTWAVHGQQTDRL